MIQRGVWVTMVTPFCENGSIDMEAIPALVDYYAERCDGIFALCQSSEVFWLSLEERISLAKAVIRAAKGRVSVIVSGHTADTPREQAEELRQMADTGAEAVVLIANRLATADESDEVWIQRADALLGNLSDIPLGIYECPYPYKRMMSHDMLNWCKSTGRFEFLKDTCCDAVRIRERLRALTDTSLRLFNANTATLLDSVQNGCYGYSGVMANFHPELYGRFLTLRESEPERAVSLQGFLTLMSWIEGRAYPACAKLHMQMLGLPIQVYCRNGAHLRLQHDSRMEIEQMVGIERMLWDKYK